MSHYVSSLLWLVVVVLSVLTTGCTVTLAGSGPPPPVVVGTPRTAHVPPGQYPPPGHCRLWYPDRPPGHQPPPMPCEHLTAGPGSFILYNNKAWDADYDWPAHAHRHPGSVPRIIIRLTTY